MSLPQYLVAVCQQCGSLLEAKVVSWSTEAVEDDQTGAGVQIELSAFAEHTCGDTPNMEM